MTEEGFALTGDRFTVTENRFAMTEGQVYRNWRQLCSESSECMHSFRVAG